MPAYKVETIEKWNKFADRFREKGYHPWQFQYGHWCPEGLHAWFRKTGEEDIEVVTKSKEVHEAIMKFSK
jgi:hypothetical protein